MHTFLILAGRSRRFWPLSEKSLFPICGKTVLEHQLERLKEGGCTDITLVTGAHNKKEIRRMFPKFRQIEQKDLDLGMLGAFLSALPKAGNKPCLFVSGNDLIEPEAFRNLLNAAAQKGIAGALLAQRVKKYFPGGYLTVKGGRITDIVEKPGPGKEPSKLVNIVAHVHNDPKALLAELKKTSSAGDDGYERALASLFKTHKYKAVPYTGTWQAIKYPWHLLHLLPLLLAEITKPHISKSASIHPSAVIEGNVVIGEGTRIFAHATVAGPCYIGKNVIIGNNALVRGSSIGDNSVVGYSSEVKGSVIAGPVWTHMTYLGDSVIGQNVSFGGGSSTGNLRFDEGEITSVCDDTQIPTGLTKLGTIIGNDCRFGIQIGTNPGVKIGAGTFVSGGILVPSDVPDKSFLSIKDGVLRVLPNKMAAPEMEEREKYRKKI